MARVKTLMTHNNPPGVRRNPGDVYDTSEYQMLSDRRIVDVVNEAEYTPKKAEVEPEVESVPEEVEEVVEPPLVANKQMGAESKEDQPKPGKTGGKKYKRRDMTAEG
jgi:hypothetical protein